MQFQNQTEAAAFGLFLAITAPTEKQSNEALALAERICQGLTAGEVEQAKRQAQDLVANA